jgi:hypothetical protein
MQRAPKNKSVASVSAGGLYEDDQCNIHANYWIWTSPILRQHHTTGPYKSRDNYERNGDPRYHVSLISNGEGATRGPASMELTRRGGIDKGIQFKSD